jgi:hypothetical protein
MKKKTIKLVSKLLKNENKRQMYSDQELIYMEKYLDLMKEERTRRKLNKKKNKGFANDE